MLHKVAGRGTELSVSVCWRGDVMFSIGGCVWGNKRELGESSASCLVDEAVLQSAGLGPQTPP